MIATVFDLVSHWYLHGIRFSLLLENRASGSMMGRWYSKFLEMMFLIVQNFSKTSLEIARIVSCLNLQQWKIQ